MTYWEQCERCGKKRTMPACECGRPVASFDQRIEKLEQFAEENMDVGYLHYQGDKLQKRLDALETLLANARKEISALKALPPPYSLRTKLEHLQDRVDALECRPGEPVFYRKPTHKDASPRERVDAMLDVLGNAGLSAGVVTSTLRGILRDWKRDMGWK